MLCLTAVTVQYLDERLVRKFWQDLGGDIRKVDSGRRVNTSCSLSFPPSTGSTASRVGFPTGISTGRACGEVSVSMTAEKSGSVELPFGSAATRGRGTPAGPCSRVPCGGEVPSSGVGGADESSGAGAEIGAIMAKWAS